MLYFASFKHLVTSSTHFLLQNIFHYRMLSKNVFKEDINMKESQPINKYIFNPIKSFHKQQSLIIYWLLEDLKACTHINAIYIYLILCTNRCRCRIGKWCRCCLSVQHSFMKSEFILIINLCFWGRLWMTGVKFW